MSRRLLKKFVPDPQRLQGRWFLRPFGTRLGDPRLWTLSRRGESSTSTSFGSGEFTWDYEEPPHNPEPVTARCPAPALELGGVD